MASGSNKIVRWPWLILAALGFIGCVTFLLMSLTGRSSSSGGGNAAKSAPASEAMRGPPMTGGVPERRPPAAAMPMPAPSPPPPAAPVPTTADPKVEVKADKPTPTANMKKVGGKHTASKPRPNGGNAPPPPPMARTTPRTVAVDDADERAAPEKAAAPDREKLAKHHRRKPKPVSDAPVEETGKLGSIGRMGHAAGPPGPPPAPGEEDGDAHGAAEAKAFADLLPGRFSAKVPQRMLINESVRVRAVVAEKKDERKATAVIEAAPVGPGPSKIVTEEVLVGKLLRVELRGLSREFEIMPITPAEQRLYAGRVAQWEWVVVPREEGSHELSIVVTNLYDWSGRPLDLTVHSALVSVDVTTMQRLRGYASVVSSIFSGITGLIGAWMALLRPFLRRRAEKEEEDKEKKKEKESKDGADAKPAEKAPDSPPLAAAAPAAPPAESAPKPAE